MASVLSHHMAEPLCRVAWRSNLRPSGPFQLHICSNTPPDLLVCCDSCCVIVVPMNPHHLTTSGPAMHGLCKIPSPHGRNSGTYESTGLTGDVADANKVRVFVLSN